MPAAPNATLVSEPRSAQSPGRIVCLNLDEWQEFALSQPGCTTFHHRNWIELIQRQYGLKLYIPASKQSGEIRAAIPFLCARSIFGKTKVVSLPFTDCLGLLARSSQDAGELVTGLLREPPACTAMSMRTDAVLTDVPSVSHMVRHEVEVGPSFSGVSNRFKSSVHRNLHKARRLGLQFVRADDLSAMEEFFRLHVLTRRKLGVPVQPKKYFECLHSSIVQQGLGYVGLVMKGRKPIAGGVFLTFNNTVIYKYAASLPAALADRPNDWLVYNALQTASDEGYRAFDFGISERTQEGLRRFKRNWGAKEIDVYSVQLVGQPKPSVEDSAAFKIASYMIRHSPTVVCRGVGKLLYRFAV